MGDEFSAISEQLGKANTCLFHVFQDDEAAREMLQERDKLREEMNDRIREAISLIESEYQERIEDIETQIVMYLQLSMPAAGGN